MIVQRHAVYSALFLIITMGALAGIYILLEAHFVWVVQVIVYAGAIMVLFLFVIMLLDIRREQDPWAPPGRGRILAALLLSVVLLVELGMVVAQRLVLPPAGRLRWPAASARPRRSGGSSSPITCSRSRSPPSSSWWRWWGQWSWRRSA